jgi:hypothetical protein
MNDAQIIAIVKCLMQLKAENLALYKWLLKDSVLPTSGLVPQIAEQRQRLEQLPAIAHALARTDPSQLPILLGTLSAVRPQ